MLRSLSPLVLTGGFENQSGHQAPLPRHALLEHGQDLCCDRWRALAGRNAWHVIGVAEQAGNDVPEQPLCQQLGLGPGERRVIIQIDPERVDGFGAGG